MGGRKRLHKYTVCPYVSLCRDGRLLTLVCMGGGEEGYCQHVQYGVWRMEETILTRS